MTPRSIAIYDRFLVSGTSKMRLPSASVPPAGWSRAVARADERFRDVAASTTLIQAPAERGKIVGRFLDLSIGQHLGHGDHDVPNFRLPFFQSVICWINSVSAGRHIGGFI